MFQKYINTKFITISVFLSAFILITVVCVFSAQKILSENQKNLANDSQKVKMILEDEIKHYAFGLQAVKGAILNNKFQFNSAAFRQHAEIRDFFLNFKGSLGFGFIRYVPNNIFKKYQTLQKSKDKEFQVHPIITANEHMIIELIEPLEKNKPARGLDIAFEANRREAALMAAKTGKLTMTKKVTLVQQQKKHTGFLYFLPIYKTITIPNTENERLKNLVGWSYTPVILEEILQAVATKIPLNVIVKIEVDQESKPLSIGSEPNSNLSKFIAEDIDLNFNIEGQTWKIHIQQIRNEIYQSFVFLFIIYLLAVSLLIFGGLFIYKKILGKDKYIEEKQTWLNAIVNSAGYAVIATKANGQIITFNPAAEKILGYKASEVIGTNSILKFHKKSELIIKSQELSKELNQTIEPNFQTLVIKANSGISDTNEWTYVTKNGDEVPTKLCMTAIHDNTFNIIGYLGISEDLSSQKKLLHTIDMQRAKMLESAKMSLLGEMAGGIAHEINTPLAIIVGKSSLLCEKLSKQILCPNDIIGELKKIDKTANRIAKIVKGLRLFSRNSENDQMTDILISSTVEATLDLCHEKIIHNLIQLNVDTRKELWISARPAEISQVILNLISNSIDAIQNLNEKWISVNVYRKNNKVCIEITDSGYGIEPHIVEKMMNPFFTTKEVGKGTGLGLSISKGIIESHGGSLKYDANCVNTRFVIELPEIAAVNQQQVA